jgi:hypothetical protein
MKEKIVQSFFVFFVIYITPNIFELTHTNINISINVGDAISNNYS